MADSPASLYRTLLEAVAGRLTELLSPSGWNVALLAGPAWSPTHVELPSCVIAPRADLVESVGVETFNNGAWLGFDVLVGLFTDDRSPGGLEQVWKLAAARQAVRLALWKPGAPGLGREWFDCDYQPLSMYGQSPPDNVSGSWQQFTFSVSTTRQTPEP